MSTSRKGKRQVGTHSFRNLLLQRHALLHVFVAKQGAEIRSRDTGEHLPEALDSPKAIDAETLLHQAKVSVLSDEKRG